MDKDRRTKLKNDYKQAAQPAGVFKITNTANGKIFIGSSVNVPGRLNRYRLELEMGSCRIPSLQDDWKANGSEVFTFEILELIDPGTEEKDIADEVSALEELYLEQLQPYADKGYNKKPS